MYTLQELAQICNGKLFSKNEKQSVSYFGTDSRQKLPANSLFIALKGSRFDGHEFIQNLPENGVSCLISDERFISPDRSFVLVNDTLHAFQQIAAHHRLRFQIPVVGITGSTAKTIIKEWLFQLLSPNFYVVKSPKSYNSQVGVPLSVLRMNEAHELAIFEAGISLPNEMSALAKMIQPNIGILTNIGDAHASGFTTKEEKLQEKLALFETAKTIICEENEWIEDAILIQFPKKKLITWSVDSGKIICGENQVEIPVKTEPYFAKNVGHCVALMLHLGLAESEIEFRIQQLQTLPMRLEVVNGQQGNIILNDSYSNDLAGLEICLSHANQIAPNKPIGLILSTFQESGLPEELLREKLAKLFFDKKVDYLVLIGSFFKKNEDYFSDLGINAHFFETTNEAITNYNWSNLHQQMLVVKGARVDQLEQIVAHLKERTHQTVWEINLSQLIENLNYFKSRLQKNVRLLVMVKATAYGTEANKIAQTLQQQRVDYLGVAYPDEGVALRQDGITLPILIMNCSASHFQLAVDYNLQVQVYSVAQLQQLINFCERNNIEKFPIHLKLETGMNRLGFLEEELPKLISLFQINQNLLEVKGILSHLAVSDEENEVDFTNLQVDRFKRMTEQIIPHLDSEPILHLLNSEGIASGRFPQFNMVRLGIGLHGISSNKIAQQNIKQVGKLIATISQIKTVQPGDTVGYGRRFVAKQDTKIATISVGYADGYDRRLGNGVGEVILHSKRAKTVGNICMDMCMIDISHIPQAKVGDEVVLTNHQLTTAELAKRINTIPYELLTSISTRVQRRFVYD